MRTIQSNVFSPPDALCGYVECFRTFRVASREAIRVRICPNGLPGIAFQHHQGASALESITIPSRQDSLPPPLFLYGQVTTLSEMHFTPPYVALQVVFKPYALWSLFGFDAQLLANKSLRAAEFGADHLAAQLVTAASDEERAVLCSSFLESKLAQARTDTQIERAVALIEQDIETITVQSVQDQIGLSERQLERRFKQVVGLTPRFYIRLRRINAALELMNSGKYPRLIDVAHALNFHDQSHFIHDMKEFSGLAPRDISQRVDDFYHDRAGSSYLLF